MTWVSLRVDGGSACVLTWVSLRVDGGSACVLTVGQPMWGARCKALSTSVPRAGLEFRVGPTAKPENHQLLTGQRHLMIRCLTNQKVVS